MKWTVRIYDTRVYTLEVEASSRQEAKLLGQEECRQGKARILKTEARVAAEPYED